MIRTKKAALLLMGGTGDRLGSKIPKQFLPLGGRAVYLHTLDRLQEISFDEIILVVCPGWEEQVRAEVAGVKVVTGGATRRESSYAGLLACANPDIVLIHDAVRPFVSRRILEENLQKAEEWGAVDTCIPSHDTLVYAPDGEKLTSIPKRSDFLRGQTPQTFHYSLIRKAHETVQTEVTDDCALVLAMNHPVGVVLGESSNMKITTYEDLLMATTLLSLQERMAPTQEGRLRKDSQSCSKEDTAHGYPLYAPPEAAPRV